MLTYNILVIIYIIVNHHVQPAHMFGKPKVVWKWAWDVPICVEPLQPIGVHQLSDTSFVFSFLLDDLQIYVYTYYIHLFIYSQTHI